MPRLILTLPPDDFQRLAERAQREDREIRHEAERLLRIALQAESQAAPYDAEATDAR